MHNWDDIRFFLAVARTGSVSAAAARLGVNQSTTSRRIVAFEAKLNVRLFERLSTGHALTSEGEELLLHAQRIEEEALAIERKLKGKNIELSGPIRCTTSLVFYRYLLAPAIKAFNDSHPQIEIQLDLSNDLYDLSQRKADVAFRVSHNGPPENLVGRQLGTMALGVYAHESYLSMRSGDQPLAWIGEDDAQPRPAWLSPEWSNLKLVMRCNDVLGTVEAVKSGMGVGRLPRVIGEHELGVVRLSEGELPVPVPVWMLTHPELRSVSRIRAFREFVWRYFNEKQLIF